MRSLAYPLPALPGFDSPKTFAAWPCRNLRAKSDDLKSILFQ
jgi:hypothetical protein